MTTHIQETKSIILELIKSKTDGTIVYIPTSKIIKYNDQIIFIKDKSWFIFQNPELLFYELLLLFVFLSGFLSSNPISFVFSLILFGTVLFKGLRIDAELNAQYDDFIQNFFSTIKNEPNVNYINQFHIELKRNNNV